MKIETNTVKEKVVKVVDTKEITITLKLAEAWVLRDYISRGNFNEERERLLPYQGGNTRYADWGATFLSDVLFVKLNDELKIQDAEMKGMLEI